MNRELVRPETRSWDRESAGSREARRRLESPALAHAVEHTGFHPASRAGEFSQPTRKPPFTRKPARTRLLVGASPPEAHVSQESAVGWGGLGDGQHRREAGSWDDRRTPEPWGPARQNPSGVRSRALGSVAGLRRLRVPHLRDGQQPGRGRGAGGGTEHESARGASGGGTARRSGRGGEAHREGGERVGLRVPEPRGGGSTCRGPGAGGRRRAVRRAQEARSGSRSGETRLGQGVGSPECPV